MMRNNPAFTGVAVTALALGIGANIGIFSVVDRVLLEPLPYPQPERIVQIGRKYATGEGYANSIPKYMIWRRNTVFSAMAIYDQQGPGLNLSSGDHPEQVKGVHVSADYFRVFGVRPLLGRAFTGSEDAPQGARAAIISERLWNSHFGRNPHILDHQVTLNGESYAVAGVLPGSFDPIPPADVWLALQADPNSTNQGHYLSVAARLKEGTTLESAQAQMRLRGEEFRRLNPKSMDKDETVAVTRLRDSIVHDVRPALVILSGAVVMVLLIACANVANLLLARAASRQRELAIRAAIGASRWRVVQQLLTESIILSLLGGALGFLIGAWGLRSILLLTPGNIPRLTGGGSEQHLLSLIDWRVAGFSVGISFLTGILFGLFPALQISNPDVASTLKEASGRSGTGRRQNRVRKVLVAGEMALALVLLASAMLLIKTFAGLSRVDSGLDPHHVMTLQTSLAGSRYAGTAKVENFTVQALQRIESIPGVEGAAVAVSLPTTSGIDLPFNIAGKAPHAGEDSNGDEQWRSVSAHYFPVFKIPVLRGRAFTEHDVGNSAKIAVINQAFAKKYWPGKNPVGQVITIGKGLGPQFADQPRQITGVVGNVRETGLEDSDVAVMYIPQSQVPEGLILLANSVMPLSWCVRSNVGSGPLQKAIQKEIQAIDSQMPLSNIRPMDEILAKATTRQNFNMLLLSTFAAIALVLAAIGIYGLMSYSVEQQTQELGIRMALGADRPDLLKLIMKQGMTPAGVGVVAGLCIAFGVTRLLASLLFGVQPTDLFSFGSVAAVLTAVAFLATYIPARRAMRIDPVVALREE